MYYEINVSLNGQHLFATAERSITDEATKDKVLKIFKQKFPYGTGYLITVTLWEKVGKIIEGGPK